MDITFVSGINMMIQYLYVLQSNHHNEYDILKVPDFRN